MIIYQRSKADGVQLDQLTQSSQAGAVLIMGTMVVVLMMMGGSNGMMMMIFVLLLGLKMVGHEIIKGTDGAQKSI